jgi:virginiamycin B lyase
MTWRPCSRSLVNKRSERRAVRERRPGERAEPYGRITPTGSITLFPVPSGSFRITAGPDGNLWFTEENGNLIGRITPAGLFTSGFLTPTAKSRPEGITVGPDGNIWFTEENASKIGRITTS